MISKFFKRAIAVSALLACGGAFALPDLPFSDFKVNEGAIPGVNGSVFDLGGINKLFTANKLSGQYTERLIITGANTFQTAVYLNISGFAEVSALNGATTAITPTYLNNIEAFGGYKLYVTLVQTGHFTGVGSGITFTTDATDTGTFQIWADTKSDSVLGFNVSGSGTATVSATTQGVDDVLLASTSSFVGGSGSAASSGSATIAKGDFAVVFNQNSLSATGAQYFYDPVPFYMYTRGSGQVDQLVSVGLGNVSNVTGSVDIRFGNPIPEPTSLALVGLALAGIGFSARRRS